MLVLELKPGVYLCERYTRNVVAIQYLIIDYVFAKPMIVSSAIVPK